MYRSAGTNVTLEEKFRVDHKNVRKSWKSEKMHQDEETVRQRQIDVSLW